MSQNRPLTPTYAALRVWVNTTLVRNPMINASILEIIAVAVFLTEYSVLLLSSIKSSFQILYGFFSYHVI